MDSSTTHGRRSAIGGSRGIGLAIARSFASEGVDVVLAARSVEALELAAKTLSQETGRRVIGVPTDTGDDGSVRALVQRTVDELGGVD
ncbi:SDR family NAD(P)-dependent oxidoreductase, partial [Rhodococcus sp. IEGM 69]|uniref:SDR family NAD(P)-dependent oxidoreductase n=1 Tax=Rhodococcus sp. IEGM 69 TaxID=3082229 RepID=UPI00295469E6